MYNARGQEDEMRKEAKIVSVRWTAGPLAGEVTHLVQYVDDALVVGDAVKLDRYYGRETYEGVVVEDKPKTRVVVGHLTTLSAKKLHLCHSSRAVTTFYNDPNGVQEIGWLLGRCTCGSARWLRGRGLPFVRVVSDDPAQCNCLKCRPAPKEERQQRAAERSEAAKTESAYKEIRKALNDAKQVSDKIGRRISDAKFDVNPTMLDEAQSKVDRLQANIDVLVGMLAKAKEAIHAVKGD